MSLDADSRLRTQISRNHRRGLAVVITFVILGIAIGAFAGLIWRGTHGAEIGAAIAFALLAGAAGYVLADGERLILQSSGARPADPASYPELFEIRDDLALRAGMARPSLYVIDDPSPNAFASGLRIKHASIAVTTGLLETMSREELAGVLGHEMSHIRNRDMVVLCLVSTVIGLAALLADWAWLALDRLDDRDDDDDQFRHVIGLSGLTLWIFAVFLGPLLQLAIARSRESLADLAGIQLAGEPTGLLSALRKLAANDRRLIASNRATASLFISNPLGHHSNWFNSLFDTHPRIEERIAVLQAIAGVPVTAFEEHRRIEAAYSQAKAAEQMHLTKSEALEGLAYGAGIVLGVVITVTHFIATDVSNALIIMCLVLAIGAGLVALLLAAIRAGIRQLIAR